MKNQNFKISTTNLDTATEQVITLSLNVKRIDAMENVKQTGVIWPSQIKIENGTGQLVKALFCLDKEYTEYVAAKATKGYFEINLGTTGITAATTLTGALTGATYDININGNALVLKQFTIAGTESNIGDVVAVINGVSDLTATLTSNFVTGNSVIKVEYDILTDSAIMTPDLAAFYSDLGAKITGGPFTVTTGLNFATRGGFDFIEIADSTTYEDTRFPRHDKVVIIGKATTTAALTINCFKYRE